MSFPKDFIWAVATSAYQIEGAAFEDEKGPSIWDTFCQKPNAIWNKHTGNTAADHYHRFKEDVSLIKELGVSAYRLSISWPRILPEGIGKANPKGLAFYDQLIDELLSVKIVPYVTLYHWDYPQALQDKDGWCNPNSPDWFADYTKIVVDKLSDRVQHWIPLNEPQCFIELGYHEGCHAPGLKLPFPQVLRAAHHTLLAHGKSVQTIRAVSKNKCEVGYAPLAILKVPATNHPDDIHAARIANFSITEKDCWNNSYWLDPIYKGCYPEDALELFAKDMPIINDEDMKIIHQPLDFFGINIYSSDKVRAGHDGKPEEIPMPVEQPYTTFRWPVVPESLYWGPKFLWERYKMPIKIFENGMPNSDWISLDGKVHDPQRIDFLQKYLLELQKACHEGVDVRAYFLWSLMDNFEWAEGYRERFGIIYIDYPNQRRILKDSALWYKEMIASNGATLEK